MAATELYSKAKKQQLSRPEPSCSLRRTCTDKRGMRMPRMPRLLLRCLLPAGKLLAVLSQLFLLAGGACEEAV